MTFLEQSKLKIAQEGPNLRACFAALAPPRGRSMLQVSREPWPPAGVSVARLSTEAGPIHVPAAFEHRLLVHASRSTWSVCRESGGRFLRRRDDIDIVPAGEQGGYDAETPCDMLELRIRPGLIERVAEEAGRLTPRSGLQPRHMLKDEKISYLAWALESERHSIAPAGRLRSPRNCSA
jgi:AraC family transcriptional regulator